VARDDWRLRIELGDEAAGGLAARLGLVDTDADELASELRHRRLAVSHDGPTLFVYATSPAGLAAARKVIERELADLDLAPLVVVPEHWLPDEERWDDDPPARDEDDELLSEGYAPWEVRIPCRNHAEARELAERLEREGYGVVRRWTYVIAGCATKADADALAARLRGQVEVGGDLVWETGAHNPFVIFSGIGGGGLPV
jgi:hypothetical protein